jgi:4-diphosphocytidyl-2-C-methyl-D-erythritol kinase
MTGWREAPAPAKLNLALVVGPLREDGKHEVVTVLERLALADTVAVRRAEATRVAGFDDDTLVRDALAALGRAAAGAPCFEARIEKRIPVAAGLAGGSSDAATALVLANELLAEPLAGDVLERIAASLGADVPFFLRPGPQLGTGDGTTLTSLELPRDYTVVLVFPQGEGKESTAAVYAAFDARGGEQGFEVRSSRLRRVLESVASHDDLAELPPNDLAGAGLAADLLRLGAFRADVTGAGPVVYGLFSDPADTERAASTLAPRAAVWVTAPG